MKRIKAKFDVSFDKQRWLIFLLFILLGFLVYSNTFDSPFHFDDSNVVSELTFESMLKKCKGGGSRVIAHLTFLFNYWLQGTNVFGYHILNTLVHIGTVYFVYLFLSLVLSVSISKYPSSRIYASNRHTARFLPPLSDPVFWPALFGGILFLVHPIATQAVTYITQRYTSVEGLAFVTAVTFEAGDLPAWKRWKRDLWIFLLVLVLLSGLTYSRNRVWKTDLTLWKDCIAKSPNKARPHSILGLALTRRGSLEAGIRHYFEALRIEPDYVDAHNNLGVALLEQGSLQGAINHFQKTIQLYPSHVAAYTNLGICYRNKGWTDKAIWCFEQAIQIEPDYALAHYNLGLAYGEKEKFDLAFKEMSLAKRLSSDHQWGEIAKRIRRGNKAPMAGHKQ